MRLNNKTIQPFLLLPKTHTHIERRSNQTTNEETNKSFEKKYKRRNEKTYHCQQTYRTIGIYVSNTDFSLQIFLGLGRFFAGWFFSFYLPWSFGIHVMHAQIVIVYPMFRSNGKGFIKNR